MAATPLTGRQAGIAALMDPADFNMRQATMYGKSPLAKMYPKTWEKYRPPIHSSSVRDFFKCPRYFFWKYRVGACRKGTYTPALHFGQVFHKAIELAYKGLDPDARRRELLKYGVKWCVDNLNPLANKMGLLPNGKSLADATSRVTEDTEKAIATAEVFLTKYPVDLERWEVLATEEKILAKVAYSKQPLIGTLDLVLRDRKTGRIWILDYKTTSKAPQIVADGVPLDIQPTVYRLLAMARWPDSVIAGFIHAIVLKPGIKYCPDTKDKEGWPAYIKRLTEWYGTKEEEAEALSYGWPMILSELPFRDKIPSDRDMLEAITLVGAKCRNYMRLKSYPRCGNMYTCVGVGNMPSCEFLDLCTTERNPGLVQITLLDKYVQDHRDTEDKPDE